MKCKDKEIQNSFLKLTTCLILLFLCHMFSLPWKYWPKKAGKYSSLLNVLSFSLINVKMNSFSYKLIAMFALYADCLECSNI